MLHSCSFNCFAILLSFFFFLLQVHKRNRYVVTRLHSRWNASRKTTFPWFVHHQSGRENYGHLADPDTRRWYLEISIFFSKLNLFLFIFFNLWQFFNFCNRFLSSDQNRNWYWFFCYNLSEKIVAILKSLPLHGTISWYYSFYMERKYSINMCNFSRSDIASIGAGYGLNLLEKRPSVPRRTLRELLPPNIPHCAIHLINTLIVFNPNHRLTAVQALEHPYVAE